MTRNFFFRQEKFLQTYRNTSKKFDKVRAEKNSRHQRAFEFIQHVLKNDEGDRYISNRVNVKKYIESSVSLEITFPPKNSTENYTSKDSRQEGLNFKF